MRSRSAILTLALLAAAAGCSENQTQEPNRRPELGSMTPQQTVRSNEIVRDTITASDADGDPITFQIIDNPGFVSIADLSQQGTQARATLVFAPTAAHVGTHQVSLRAADSHGEADSANCAIQVLEVSVASLEVSPGNVTIVIGATAQLTAILRDA